MTNRPRYRLGAEELIELGRSGNAEHLGRRPYFQSLGARGPAAPSKLPVALGTFSELSGVPLATLGSSAVASKNAADGLLAQVPALRGFLSAVEALAAADAGSKCSGLGCTELKNVEVGVAQALGARRAVEIPFNTR